MIKTYKLSEIAIEDILKRDIEEKANVDDIVFEIIENVKKNKDKALLEYAEKFDKAKLTSLEVTKEEIDEAYNSADKYFIETLNMAAENIRLFHSQQLHKNFNITTPDGAFMGQKYTPVEKAGIYVPGGTASYPSTVLMDAIPAQIAGVKEIVMTTPSGADGKIAPEILCAAKVAGVTRIFKTGGAQAIAALAYGTESIPRVDKIVGPGNVFVATAKRMVYGRVSIDMIAGPSDILVLCDDTCNAEYVAADMLGQAEHDKLATAVMITTSEKLAADVALEIERRLKTLPREEIARCSIETTGKIIIAESMDEAIEAANAVAPEHLEICTDEPFALLDKVKNAGSIFLGKNSPEALGDYFAGPNHTLPTSGTARFSSPLSVDDFVKKSSFLYYPESALKKYGERIVDFARREGLEAHARSVTVRLENDEK